FLTESKSLFMKFLYCLYCPNAGPQPRLEAGATEERSNCLGCQGGLVYFFSSAPPEVATASAASAWRSASSTTDACTPSGRLFCLAPPPGAVRQRPCSAG